MASWRNRTAMASASVSSDSVWDMSSIVSISEGDGMLRTKLPFMSIGHSMLACLHSVERNVLRFLNSVDLSGFQQNLAAICSLEHSQIPGGRSPCRLNSGITWIHPHHPGVSRSPWQCAPPPVDFPGIAEPAAPPPHGRQDRHDRNASQASEVATK